MMLRQSPPKHRHDGTSPLPLGMDWSPSPRKWNGRETVWPHGPHTGWSYCVTIPSWIILPKSRDSDPVVFYRVQVGLQSPEGITTTRGILRRFNDFMKLFGDLRKAFPKKNLPPAPPKGLLRMKTRALLEERRRTLEDWLTKLLSDIDLSRSVSVASFLELEATARSSFQDANQQSSETNPSNSTSSLLELHPNTSLSELVGSSSITSDYGSDTAYETSDLGTPTIERDNSSEVGIEDLSLDGDMSSPIEKLVKYGISNIDEGLFMGQTILEQLEGIPKHRVHSTKINTENGSASKSVFLSAENENGRVGHGRKLSSESVGSDTSSLRGSGMSNYEILNSFSETELQFSYDGQQVVLPSDQRHKLNRVLMTMQRRLVAAKTDMEDLIARLNQEIAVKDYLTTKVKDLEVELEATKQKSKENLQHAILIERERITQMQWDMQELRHTSLELESKLKAEQDERVNSRSTKSLDALENDEILKELSATKLQLENSLKRNQELEVKLKADIKVLVKEVKLLRSSQTELKQELSQSLEEKSEAERLLKEERQKAEEAKTARRKLLQECRVLHNKLQECNINFLTENEDRFPKVSSSLSDTLDFLTTFDDQVSLLLEKARVLAEDGDKVQDDDDDAELRKMMSDIFIDNTKLRKQVNFVIRRALKLERKSEKDDDQEDLSGETVLHNYIER